MGSAESEPASCKVPDFREIQDAVRKKYTEISQSAEGKFTYPTGREGASALAYDKALISEMPPELMGSFCGVGNPFGLGPIEPGEKVLDVGCGAGFDLIVASRMVGPGGRACGIDITPDMAERARANTGELIPGNAEVRVAGAEKIPYPDGYFDVVTSNGVLNLSPLKEKCFSEIYRVLKPGGRLQFADVVLMGGMDRKQAGSLEAWSD